MLGNGRFSREIRNARRGPMKMKLGKDIVNREYMTRHGVRLYITGVGIFLLAGVWA